VMVGFADVESEPYVVFGIHDSPPRPSSPVVAGLSWHPMLAPTLRRDLSSTGPSPYQQSTRVLDSWRQHPPDHQ